MEAVYLFPAISSNLLDRAEQVYWLQICSDGAIALALVFDRADSSVADFQFFYLKVINDV